MENIVSQGRRVMCITPKASRGLACIGMGVLVIPMAIFLLGVCVAPATGQAIFLWGSNSEIQCNVPRPNRAFEAVAAGYNHTLGLKGGIIQAWRRNMEGQCNVPNTDTCPNSSYVAMAAGFTIRLGLKADGSIVNWGRTPVANALCPSPIPPSWM
jgi:hypothetical protein